MRERIALPKHLAQNRGRRLHHFTELLKCSQPARRVRASSRRFHPREVTLPTHFTTLKTHVRLLRRNQLDNRRPGTSR